MKGFEIVPVFLSSRIIFMIMFVSSLFLFETFSASYTSFLSGGSSSPPRFFICCLMPWVVMMAAHSESLSPFSRMSSGSLTPSHRVSASLRLMSPILCQHHIRSIQLHPHRIFKMISSQIFRSELGYHKDGLDCSRIKRSNLEIGCLQLCQVREWFPHFNDCKEKMIN